jgi:hypothetical protein
LGRLAIDDLEASIPTITDNLAQLLAERDAATEHIKSWPAAIKSLAQPTIDLLTMAGVTLLRMKELPPSNGYEPLFVESDYDPILARGLADLAVRYGKLQARDSKRHRIVADAIRLLATSRRKSTVLSRAKLLLAARNETSILEAAFSKAGLSETEFVGLLEAILRGENADYQRLTELATEVAARLSLARGPKISAPSASHAFLLKHQIKLSRKRLPYSRRDRTAKNCDALTEATQREFGDPTFDSRPARRRSKKRKHANVN